MPKTLIVLVALLTAGPALSQASHAVRGHVTASGVYVAPTRATNPNITRLDNYSTRPNVNPYSGRIGTVNPYATPVYRPYRPR